MASKVDVFISGAGPTGLILAYQLARQGISVCIIDAADKGSPDFPMYGRACSMYPRTLEMIDQLDLFDDMAQVGLATNSNATYANGRRVQGRGFSLIGQLGIKTFFDYTLNIRLKYSEDILRRKITQLGVLFYTPARLIDFKLEDTCTDDHRVKVKFLKADLEQSCHISARYIVGCDGGSSTVRTLAGIPFTGARQIQHWVRIDGLVRTNVPEARAGFCSFETERYGQVLWNPLDHGVTRIGYALTPELYKQYGSSMTAAEAVLEAKNAVAPFQLEYERVDWHTVYGIQQHVADRLQDRERILIAGDAAHTHSSGLAQGMNTGIGDVVSLGWRLSGVIKGLYKPCVLANYAEERRAIALQLIENDKIISSLMSGKKPEGFESRTESPMALLGECLSKQATFTTGLGIFYAPSFINDVAGSYPPVVVEPGYRAPDVTLNKPGLSNETVRLHTLAKNNGRFKIIVFTGRLPDTRKGLEALRLAIDGCKIQDVADFITIVAGAVHGFDEVLPVPKFGSAYWDVSQHAHREYNISMALGTIVVLRPDGILGFVAPLDAFHSVQTYFKSIIATEL